MQGVQVRIIPWKVDSHHIIRSETDFHAVFPVPIETVLHHLLDYDGIKDTYPRVRDSYVVDAEKEPFGRHTVRTYLGIKVLGFGETYTYITNNWVEPQGDKSYIQKYNLEESVDDKLYEMLGNWYIEEVVLGGNRYTYVRQYTIIGIQRGSLAMELAMKAFGSLSLRQQFRQLSEATKGS